MMNNVEPPKNIIDFQQFKDTGELKYVTAPVSPEEEIIKDALEEMSFVMEMSTDELISEIGCRLEYGKSLRDISDILLIDELTQRLIAIKFLLAAFAHETADTGKGNEP
tara:strand:+ start:239 stop:565 length:327 start_codon:yes stop_codon:yes gene_type:complete